MEQTLAHCVSLLRKDFTAFCSRRLAEEGLSQGQLYFILYVGRHPGCRPRELAQALRADAGHTTRMLTRLAQDGFLVQEKSEADGRARSLLLTERGEAAFRLSHALFTQWDAQVLAPLGPQERSTLLALLAKLTPAEGGRPCGGTDAVHTH